MFQDFGADKHCWEDRQSANDNSPEEELIGPDIVEEGEFPCRIIGIECEHAASQALAFPGRDQDDPSQLREDGGAGPKHDVTGLVLGFVAVFSQAIAAGAVDDEDEGREAAGGHYGAVDHHISYDLPSEDALFGVVGRSLHDV